MFTLTDRVGGGGGNVTSGTEIMELVKLYSQIRME